MNKSNLEKLIDSLAPDFFKKIDEAFENFEKLPEEEKKKIRERKWKPHRIEQN
jgi:hypothetical protein